MTAEQRTEQLTASLEHALDQVAAIGMDGLFVYVHPAGEPDARTALLGLNPRRRPPRLFVSPLVPPGELRVTATELDDPEAREVHP